MAFRDALIQGAQSQFYRAGSDVALATALAVGLGFNLAVPNRAQISSGDAFRSRLVFNTGGIATFAILSLFILPRLGFE